ncbi:nucleoside 2-deoxyribosyltransferase [Devosia ginsengisoli]|uniref:nucleoside 2-deoxyribosyltransferase n=1 Tax=Devosia ginsengisoli TaxID=400770 RepID=UPI0026EB9694|nr:nucleoside 2-deoxyribosyltransferase [Devosia ginsengisoli]MCR6672718.1 nucleoside 2-deoxyribosyltransferase [Devosia ginsengisoli]
MQIYLVGPITGQSTAGVLNWRERLKLAMPDQQFLDPASAPFDASLVTAASSQSVPQTLKRLQHGRFVIDRNKRLVRAADVVFANLLEAQDRISIGSVGELFWANAFGKPIVVVRNPVADPHDHAMLNAIASRICSTTEEGCDALRELANSAA